MEGELEQRMEEDVSGKRERIKRRQRVDKRPKR